jgi:hypothetical protein
MTKPTKELIIESTKYGQFKVLYDAEDEDKISKYNWCILKDKQLFYVQSSRAETTVRFHRLIMNTPKGMDTDHINGNPLDNRKENLRICTAAENARNKGPLKNNKSGFKGVNWHKRDKRWRSQISCYKKYTHIGYFKDKEEAARAYDVKAKELHGEFAYLNFPDE